MAAETLLILGESGQGKSSSLRNLNPKETFIISTTSKPLPWRGWKKNYTKWDPKSNPDGNLYQTAKSSNIITIVKYISSKRPEIKTIIIEDAQYSMSFEYMDRRKETGFQKFSEIGGDFTDLLRVADVIRDDIKLIFIGHSENVGDAMNPKYTLKTIGKMLNEKITPEGLFTYVFYAMAINGDDKMEYKFLTNTDGEHVAKTPIGMFEDKLIDNDVAEILKVIEQYNEGE
jgi:hypothetical protein